MPIDQDEASVGDRLWCRLRELQRRSFILTPEGNGVRAVKDSSGGWLNYYEVATLIDDVKTAEAEAAAAPTRPAPTYEQGVAAGLEMAAKVAETSITWLTNDKATGFYQAADTIASAIRALADQPSPAEEPKP